MTMTLSAANPPVVAQLDEESFALVWALRRLAVGEGWSSVVDYEFARLFHDGGRMRVAFRAFIVALALHGRRRLRLGLPGLPVLTPDERTFLAAVEAAAAGESERLSAHLTWLFARADVAAGLPPLEALAAFTGSSGGSSQEAPGRATCP